MVANIQTKNSTINTIVFTRETFDTQLFEWAKEKQRQQRQQQQPFCRLVGLLQNYFSTL